MKKNKIIVTIVSLITGLIFWLIGEMLFSSLTEKFFTPLGIAIYFLLFGIILFIVLSVIGFFQRDQHNKNNARNTGEALRLAVFFLVIMFVFSGVFEFLYELGDDSVPEPTSYVFLIDDSGSMSGNDPSNMRPSAISQIMKQRNDLPYAVYKFCENAELIKGMGVYSPDDISKLEFMSNGGTDVLHSVEKIVADFTQGVLSGGGQYPRIILFSDGASSSWGMRSIAKECISNGISICSVGFGSCDEGYLKRIANMTGGVYVYCDDASKIGTSMMQAASENLSRNLLSVRVVLNNDGLYCFLRILFLSLLGIIWALIKRSSTQNLADGSKNYTLIYFLICVVGALVVEFASNFLSISLVRLIFCLLWAIAFGEVLFGNEESVDISSLIGSESSPDGILPDDDSCRLKEDADGQGGIKTIIGGCTGNGNSGSLGGLSGDGTFGGLSDDGAFGGSSDDGAFGGSSGSGF